MKHFQARPISYSAHQSAAHVQFHSQVDSPSYKPEWHLCGDYVMQGGDAEELICEICSVVINRV